MIKAALVSAGLPILTYTQSAEEANVNIRSKVGSPSYAALVIITINSGINIYGSGSRALYSGTGWTTGSKIKIINNGKVYGFGGEGGAGGSHGGISGNVGGIGGDAIETTIPLEVDNTNGEIFGGGGGGGGGSGDGAVGLSGAGGGGGGGGAGRDSGSGGSGGSGSGGVAGNSGTSGTTSFGGFAGAGGDNTFYGTRGKNGGQGGEWGQDGIFSEDVVLGGTAGRAVRLNGQTITWLGGNNPAQVKGLVS